MTDWATRLSILCVAVLMPSGLASAQEVQFDLILERTFTSPPGMVGIDYDAQRRPIFTIASEDRVEVMDSRGNVETIVSGLTEFEWAGPSDNGRYVWVLKSSEAMDSLTGEPYFKYHFTLKRRNGETVYEIADCPFNDFRMSNDGSICGTWILDIDPVADWLYYDPEGNLTQRFPASSAVAFFGDSGSYLLGHGDTVSAYTHNHTLLWSVDLTSPEIGWGTSEISSDGRYFVRCGLEITVFYRDGQLVKIDSTHLESWKPRVVMTPDNKHALLISTHRAYLWDLEQMALIRTYQTEPPVSFQNAMTSWEGRYVLFSTFARDRATSGQYFVSLYDENAELVWQTEGLPEDMTILGRWLTMDPTGTYVSCRDKTGLRLYKRR